MLIIKVAFLTTTLLCPFGRQTVPVVMGLAFWWPPFPGKLNPQQAAVAAVIVESRKKCTFRVHLLVTFTLLAHSPAHYLSFASVTWKPESNQTILKSEQLTWFQPLPNSKKMNASLAITLQLKPQFFHSTEHVVFKIQTLDFESPRNSKILMQTRVFLLSYTGYL